MLFGLKMNENDACLANYATMHAILQDKRYFLELKLIKANVSTISGTPNLVEGSKRINITLPNGTRFHINDVLYSRKSRKNLLKEGYVNNPICLCIFIKKSETRFVIIVVEKTKAMLS